MIVWAKDTLGLLSFLCIACALTLHRHTDKEDRDIRAPKSHVSAARRVWKRGRSNVLDPILHVMQIESNACYFS